MIPLGRIEKKEFNLEKVSTFNILMMSMHFILNKNLKERNHSDSIGRVVALVILFKLRHCMIFFGQNIF